MAEMHYFFRHPVAEKVREEGREAGRVQDRVEMTLRILEWRGIPVSDGVRGRVRACSDLEQLEVWAQRAVHAADAEEIFWRVMKRGG
ncbi:Transposase (putative) YhgA-like domain-containing protein OS=Streptomyces fumanus OX=67302 GN=GCM10018772_60800 PE=4 SV=1 [Streptomyces fumanus]